VCLVAATLSILAFALVFTTFASAEELAPPEGVSPSAEIESSRTLFSKTWSLGDGDRVTRVSGEAIHYRDADGKLQELDLDVQTDENGDLFAEIGAAEVSLPEGDDPAVAIDDKGNSIELVLDSNDSEPSIDGSVVSFDDVLDGVNRELTVNASGVKEDLILENADSAREFTYTLSLSNGLTPRIQDDGSIAVSANGKTVFTIPAVVAFEQDSPGLPATLEKAYSLSKTGAATWRLGVNTDGEWLNDADRAWPVVIDPTIVIDRALGATSEVCLKTNVSSGCSAFSAAADVGWGQGPNLFGTMVYTSLVLKNFVVPTTLNSRIVTDAKLGVHQNYAWGRPGTAATMPPAPGTGSTSYPLPGAATQTLVVKPVTNPSNMNWPLRETWIDRQVVAAGASAEFNIAPEIRAWIAYRQNPANGWAQRGIGVQAAGAPLSTSDVNGCRIDLNVAACQGQLSQIAGLSDPTVANRPYLDIYSAPPAQAGSAIKSPEEGELTSRFIELRADAASPNVTTAKFEYVAGEDRDWRDVPAAAMRKLTDGTVMSSSTVPIGLVDGGANDALVWDLQKTPGGEVDGPVHIRAILETAGGPGGGVTPEVNIRVDRRNPASSSSQTVGPAEVDLLSGDVSITESDANISAFLTELGFSRTYHSRGVSPRMEEMFGPGWVAGFDMGEDENPFKSIYTFTEVKEGEEVKDWMLDELAAKDEAYDADDFEIEPPSEIPRFEVHYAVLEMTDGSKVTFSLQGGSWVSEDEFSMLELEFASGVFTVVDLADGRTDFTANYSGSPRYYPTKYKQPGDASGVSYEYLVSGKYTRLHRIIAPRPGTTASCTATTPWPDDCRALELNWSIVIADGKPVARVIGLRLRALDPTGTYTGTSHSIASYEYDTSGRLKKVSDPRISGGLPTQYAYDSSGRMTTYTPPGERPWTFAYQAATGDDGTGRVRSITRKTPAGVDATVTFVYDVPTTGSGAPHDMSLASVATWGQSQLPQTATAVFPPDSVPSGPGLPSSYPRATIHYISSAGKVLNTADPMGGISTSEFDKYGNPIRELSPENRVRSLAVGVGSAARSYKLDTQYEYAANGIDLITTLGPETEIRRPGGTLVDARPRTSMSYDAGKPVAFYGDRHLVTEIRNGALRSSDNAVIDEEVTTNAYSEGASNRGWELGMPMSTTVGTGGEQEVTKFQYHADYPLLTREIGPRSAGGDAQSRSYSYGIGLALLGCSKSDNPNITALRGALCSTGRSGAPPTGHPILAKQYRYSLLWDVIQVRDASQVEDVGTGQERITTINRDAIGRPTAKIVTATTGSAMAPILTTYSPTTGRPLLTGILNSLVDPTINPTITRVWDDNGRITSYTDGPGPSTSAGATTTYEYDISGRTTEIEDDLGTRTITYDDRDLVSSVSDTTLSGPIQAERNADGQLIAQDYPGNIRMERTIDNTGIPVSQTWERTGGCTVACDIAKSEIQNDAQGRVARHISDQSVSDSTYDTVGRLKRTDETRGAVCTRTDYTFDKSSNRTSIGARTSGSGGACGTGTLVTKTSSYDMADRITNPGYTYDIMGRTTTVPASDSPSGLTTAFNYAADDRNTLIWYGSTVQNLKYDPLRRIAEETTQAPGLASTVSTLRYGDDADQPTARTGTWGWERFVTDTEGMQVATTTASTDTLELSNLQGDIVATMTVGASSPASRIEYTAYGGTASTSGTLAPQGMRHGFKGAYGKNTLESPGGYVHMGARVYNPTSGRFLQMDPVDGGSANAYDYSNQDPMNQMDVTGLCPANRHTVFKIFGDKFSTWHICKGTTKNIARILRSGRALSYVSGLLCSFIKTGSGPLGWLAGPIVDGICGFILDQTRLGLLSIFGPAARNGQCVTFKAFLSLSRKPIGFELNRSTHRDYCR